MWNVLSLDSVNQGMYQVRDGISFLLPSKFHYIICELTLSIQESLMDKKLFLTVQEASL